MRYIERQLEDVRRMADQTNATSTSGISTEELLLYANNAQWELQNELLKQDPNIKYFDQQKSISAVSGTRSYSVDSTFSLDGSVRLVEYSSDGAADGYYDLDPQILKNLSLSSGKPCEYSRIGKQVTLGPIPDSSAGIIRLTGPRRLPRIDWRRGKIASSTSSTITLANDSVLGDAESINATALGNADYVCVVDKDGTIEQSGIVVTGYDSGTRVISSSSTVSVTANNYVVIGKDSTTHFQLPEEVEGQLLSYITWKVQHREESVASADTQQELQLLAQSILGRFFSYDLDIDLWQ